MLGTGGAFNVQLTPTEVAQQAAAQATTQATGRPAPADTDLIQPTSGMLQTGVDGYEAYYDSYNTLRDFADTAFIQYGIDVTKPDPRIPGSAAMVRAYNRMFSETQNLGMQLRSGYEYNKMLQEQALRGEIFLPAQFATGQISTSQTNLGALSNKTLDFITEYNKQLDNTKIVSQGQLQAESERRQGLMDWLSTDYLEQLQNQGYDPEYARQFVEDQKRRLRQPTMDEYARQTLSQDWQSLGLRERELQDKTTGGQQAAARAQIINSILTDPNSPYLNTLKGAKTEMGTVSGIRPAAPYTSPAQRVLNARRQGVAGADEFYDERVMILTLNKPTIVEGEVKDNFVEIPIMMDSPSAWSEINNLLNSLPSQGNVDPEKLVGYFGAGNVQLTPTQAGQGGQGQQPITVTSEAEYNSLKPGDKYIWNGQVYTKE